MVDWKAEVVLVDDVHDLAVRCLVVRNEIRERVELYFLIHQGALPGESNRTPFSADPDGEDDVPELVGVAPRARLEADRDPLHREHPRRQMDAHKDGLEALDRQRLLRDLLRHLHDARQVDLLPDVKVTHARVVVLERVDVPLDLVHALHRGRPRTEVAEQRHRRTRKRRVALQRGNRSPKLELRLR